MALLSPSKVGQKNDFPYVEGILDELISRGDELLSKEIGWIDCGVKSSFHLK